MAIKCAVTPRILAALNTMCGEGAVNPSDVQFYETICVTQLPLQKTGSLYEGAVVSHSFMQGMVDFVNQGGAVPLHTLHLAGDELPVGKVILADLIDDAVQAVFFVPLVEADIIAKLDTGVINEVSIGTTAQKLLCSECGFDYLSAEADWEVLWSRTCPNDHTIGTNGIHLNVSGLKDWYELSLVSRGAARGAKILPRAKQVLSAEQYGKLAATGKPVDVTYLSASFQTPTKKGTKMELQELVLSLSKAEGKVQVTELQLSMANQRATTAETELAALKLANTPEELAKKYVPLAEIEPIKAEAAAAKVTAETAIKFMQSEHNRMAVLAGVAETTEVDAVKLSESISALRLQLSAKYPHISGTVPPESTGSTSNSAYKTVK